MKRKILLAIGFMAVCLLALYVWQAGLMSSVLPVGHDGQIDGTADRSESDSNPTGADETAVRTGADGPREEARAEYVKRFGTREGEEINSGYVFIDGRYLSPPYRVSRRGLSVYINGELVDETSLPKPEKDKPPLVTEDPPLPTSITKESSYNDDDVGEHERRKLLYLMWRYPEAEADRRIIEYYRSLPYVLSVEQGSQPSGTCLIKTRKEGVIAVTWREPGAELPPPSPKLVLDSMKLSCSYLQKVLSKGGCLFISVPGIDMAWGVVFTQRKLPRIVKVVRSGMSNSEKDEALEEIGVALASERKLLIKNLRGKSLNQLESRLKSESRGSD